MGLELNKGQGQDQAKEGHQMKMLHERRATHVSSVIRYVGFEGGITFWS